MNACMDELVDKCMDGWMLKVEIDFQELKYFSRSESMASSCKDKVVISMFLYSWAKN